MKKLCAKHFCLSLAILISSFPFLAAQQKEDITILNLDTTKVNQLKANFISSEGYRIVTSGRDPWITTLPIESALSDDACVLSFQYFCPRGLDHLQVYFSPSPDEKRSKMVNNISVAEGWIECAIDLEKEKREWGKAGDWLRLDLGSRQGVIINIRNLVIRPRTDREKEIAMSREAKKKADASLEASLVQYLGTEYPAEISRVSADRSSITISGSAPAAGELYLCEVAPWEEVAGKVDFKTAILIDSSSFRLKAERFTMRDGQTYDRSLSRWVLARKSGSGYSIISHARYPDEFVSMHDLDPALPGGRKGLGGFSISRGHIEDLDELGITSATVNVWVTSFMFSKPGPQRISHSYNNKLYYFGSREVTALDSALRITSSKGIITAAIILIGKATSCPDPEIGRLLQHPDMDPAGIYSMPNFTSRESVECYSAALDFLASRYSRPDKKYGRIDHWIMHNEVDAGWVWTNMGEKTALVFMNTYVRSMRLCYAISRNYNPFSEVFISLTHHWAWTSDPKFYPSKQLLDILLKYTRAEGDFRWALAYHPYPQSLYEPKTWLDEQVDFTFATPLITFKNLEVLNAWIKLPEVLYKGKVKRTLWLSENGTNSKSYSEQDLLEQAAGFAYAWRKMEKLDGIDGFQWHNWFDHRGEGGLRLGLRRFPDDKEAPGGIKPVWHLYKAAGTKDEDAYFDRYLQVIGIKSWKDAVYRGKIK